MDKNRGWINLNGYLTFGTVGMISIDKIRKQGILQISIDQSVLNPSARNIK